MCLCACVGVYECVIVSVCVGFLLFLTYFITNLLLIIYHLLDGSICLYSLHFPPPALQHIPCCEGWVTLCRQFHIVTGRPYSENSLVGSYQQLTIYVIYLLVTYLERLCSE